MRLGFLRECERNALERAGSRRAERGGSVSAPPSSSSQRVPSSSARRDMSIECLSEAARAVSPASLRATGSSSSSASLHAQVRAVALSGSSSRGPASQTHVSKRRSCPPLAEEVAHCELRRTCFSSSSCATQSRAMELCCSSLVRAPFASLPCEMSLESSLAQERAVLRVQDRPAPPRPPSQARSVRWNSPACRREDLVVAFTSQAIDRALYGFRKSSSAFARTTLSSSPICSAHFAHRTCSPCRQDEHLRECPSRTVECAILKVLEERACELRANQLLLLVLLLSAKSCGGRPRFVARMNPRVHFSRDRSRACLLRRLTNERAGLGRSCGRTSSQHRQARRRRQGRFSLRIGAYRRSPARSRRRERPTSSSSELQLCEGVKALSDLRRPRSPNLTCSCSYDTYRGHSTVRRVLS